MLITLKVLKAYQSICEMYCGVVDIWNGQHKMERKIIKLRLSWQCTYG